MQIKNFLVGSDPELFIFDSEKNRIISSIGLIPGVKGQAFQPEGFSEGFGLQIDNILAEFNIPPTNDAQDFVTSMELMKEYVREFVNKKNPAYTIKCMGSALVDEDQLQSEEAKEFGCSPDYDAWTETMNPSPEGASTNLRTTGCHIHIGYDDHSMETSLSLIKTLDLFLGVPSVLIDPDDRRRQLYGKSGCFRFTSYGVEYRTLSGYFISSPVLEKWCFNQVCLAIKFINEGGNVMPYVRDIRKAINENDKNLAQKLVTLFKINLP